MVRSGAGLEDILAIQDVQDVQSLHPLSLGRLLISTSSGSHLAQYQPSVAIQPLHADVADVPTLFASEVNGKTVIANRDSVEVYNDLAQQPSAQWSNGAEIISVNGSVESDGTESIEESSEDSHVVVGTKGGQVTVLSVTADGLQELAYVGLASAEVAC